MLARNWKGDAWVALRAAESVVALLSCVEPHTSGARVGQLMSKEQGGDEGGRRGGGAGGEGVGVGEDGGHVDKYGLIAARMRLVRVRALAKVGLIEQALESVANLYTSITRARLPSRADITGCPIREEGRADTGGEMQKDGVEEKEGGEEGEGQAGVDKGKQCMDVDHVAPCGVLDSEAARLACAARFRD